LLCGSTVASAQEGAESGRRPGPSFWQAAGGVATINWATWAYNWYVQRWPWSKVGTQSWGENLRQGFVWDNDCFLDNQLAHPYHGSLYHNSARASGYGFWSSFPFVAAGSASWELFGENITASLNDLITTTLGGMALGEVTYRLSTLLGSSPGGGRNGLGRNLGAFALSPIARTQGFLHRRAGQPEYWAESQPEERAQLAIGRRSGHAFVELAIRYGSPFDAGVAQPYDAFEFRLQVSPEASEIIHHVDITGLLARQTLSRSARGQLVLGAFQHFNYDDLANLKYSGHSVSSALLYRRQLGARNQVNLAAHAEGLLLGGISSDHGFEWRRDYDVGPGAGARVGASFIRDGREWVRLDGRFLWLHSIHGSDADHLATFVRVGGLVPLRGSLGIGGDLAITTRHTSYKDFPSVYQRVPHLRAYLTWAPS
jgi:hypothetical protein